MTLKGRMIMTKKITALALAACMAFSVVPSVFAADDPLPTFAINAETTQAKPGDEVTYTVSLSGATGIEQIGSVLEYNSNLLEYVSGEFCMDYSYTTSYKDIIPSEKKVQAGVTFSGKYNVTNSDVYKVTFKVKEDASGLYSNTDSENYVIRFNDGQNGVLYEGDNKATKCNEAEDNISLYVGDSASVAITTDKTEGICGEEISYVVSFPEEFNASAIDLRLDYEGMEFVSIETLNDSCQLQISEDKKRLIWMQPSNKKISGDAVKLTFKLTKVGIAYMALTNSEYMTDGIDDAIPFNYTENYCSTNVNGAMIVDVSLDKSEMVVGDKLHVTLTAKAPVNVEGLKFAVNYNKDLFKLTEAPVDNMVPTKVGSATMYEEGTINYVFMSASESSNLNEDTVLMEFDLLATQAGNDFVYFDKWESLPENVVEFKRNSVVIYPQDDMEVTSTIALIDAIPEITEENFASEEVTAAVTAADNAYNALTEVKKGLITNKEKLDTAKQLIAEYTAAADKVAAQAVTDMLDAITVTAENYLEAPETIAAVKTAYEALTDAQKALVEGYDEKIAAAQAAYEEFVKQAADKEAADKAMAAKAVEYIDAIGEVTEDSRDTINFAMSFYEGLTDDQKALVPEEKKQLLDNAVLAYNSLIAGKVVAMIDALDINSADFAASSDAIAKAYNALTDAQKVLVTNYADYQKKVEEYANMKDILVTVSAASNGYLVNSVERKPIIEHQTVIAALYDSNGALIKISTIPSNDGSTIVESSGNTTLEIFVWDSLSGMTPYGSVEISR